jgi:hypothetical protein
MTPQGRWPVRKIAESVLLASVLAFSSQALAPPLARAAEPLPSQGTLLAFFGGGGSSKKSPLKKKEKELALTILSTLEKEANFLLFTESDGCKPCGKTEKLLEELAGLSPLLSLRVLTLGGSGEKAAALGIDKVPAIALLDGKSKDTGIRYYGIPLGYEFEAFLQVIVNTAHGTPGLQPETVAGLTPVKSPVTITVFVAQH